MKTTCVVWRGNGYCGKPATLAIPVHKNGAIQLVPICEDCGARAERQPTKPEIKPLEVDE